MKHIKRLALASLTLVLFSMAAWAANKKTVTISLSNPATVGSTQLAPGDYEVSWDGSGPSVDVTFSKGRREVVTVAAQMVEESSSGPYRNPATYTKLAEDGTRVITRIRVRSLSFVFPEEPQSPSVGGAGEQ